MTAVLFSATTLVLFETLLYIAVPGPSVLWDRLIQDSRIALFSMTRFLLGALPLASTSNSADPFVLPGLTMFMTVFGGIEKSRLLTSSPLFTVPPRLAILTIPLFSCLLPGTMTRVPVTPLCLDPDVTLPQVPTCVPRPVRCVPVLV